MRFSFAGIRGLIALLLAASLASGCSSSSKNLCLGGEQCTWDKNAQRQVCRCDGWTQPPLQARPDEGVYRK